MASFTQNGRAVFPLEALGRYEDARNIPPVSAIVILNRARSVVPALARLSHAGISGPGRRDCWPDITWPCGDAGR